MPLVTAAVLAYAVGLLAGFGGWVAPTIVVALGCGLAAGVRRQPVPGALLALALAGAVVAHDARRQDRACRLALGGSVGPWDGVVTGGVRAQAGGRVLLAVGSCRLPVSVAARQGQADAGDRVRVSGRLLAGGGLGEGALARVDRATIERAGHGPLLPRLRARAGRAVERVFGADAPLAAALLVADTRQIPPAVRDRFAASGLVHILSISGLHVAIVAEAVQLVLLAARLPRRGALIAALAITLGYVALLGWPAPALRAGAMLGVSAVGRLLQRPTSPWAGLAIGGGIPLLADGRIVLDLGWQLSVSGVAALIAAGALGRRWVTPRLSGWRGTVARGLLTSAVATVVTAPLVTWHFGQLSLVAPLTNLAAGPVVAVLQPALFLALVLAPVTPLARFVADAAHPLLAALDGVAAAGAAVPYGAVAVAPTLTGAFLCGVATLAVVVACVSVWPGRALLVAVGAVALAVWLPAVNPGPGELELHMLDVGQGDAIALRTPAGRWIVVDAGRIWRTGDAGHRTVVPYLRRHGGRTAAFVLSHPHADHVGGAASLVRALRPGEYWDGAYVGGSAPYRASLAAAREVGARWRRVHPGDSLRLDDVTVRFLAPDSLWLVGASDPNEASTIVLVTYGRVRFLLMGDAERNEESWLLRHARHELRADVLKVGHHGSRTSSSPEFLDAVRPRVALISVGAGNVYRHPSASVVRALADAGAQVLRTDVLGTVVVRTDGRRITLQADDDRWTLSPDR